MSHACQLFDQMPQKNTISINMMISHYVKSGNLSYARELFDATVECTSVTWTILIGGYSQSNQFGEAFKLFAAMYMGDGTRLYNLCDSLFWMY